VRTGLTDGAFTEILEVLDGELHEDGDIVTGEAAVQHQAGSSPFAINMFGKKK